LLGGDSGDRSEGGSGGHDEESGVVDPREAEHSYDFGPSIITIGHIQQLETLGFFIEGSVRKAVVFEVFFTARLQMPPQPTLTDILLKFRVQLHQLTPNAFTQFSKYFGVCLASAENPAVTVS
jgi:hypothetical protein